MARAPKSEEILRFIGSGKKFLTVPERYNLVARSMDDEKRHINVIDSRQVLELIEGDQGVFRNDTVSRDKRADEDQPRTVILCRKIRGWTSADRSPQDDNPVRFYSKSSGQVLIGCVS